MRWTSKPSCMRFAPPRNERDMAFSLGTQLSQSSSETLSFGTQPESATRLHGQRQHRSDVRREGKAGGVPRCVLRAKWDRNLVAIRPRPGHPCRMMPGLEVCMMRMIPSLSSGDKMTPSGDGSKVQDFANASNSHQPSRADPFEGQTGMREE
jgi:hypothetical protein